MTKSKMMVVLGMLIYFAGLNANAQLGSLVEKDSAIILQKTDSGQINRDFEVQSQEEEIAGDFVAGTKQAMASWKKACNEWKQERRDDNKASQIVQLNCGKPKMDKSMSATGQYRMESTGVSKVKVRVRGNDAPEKEKK